MCGHEVNIFVLHKHDMVAYFCDFVLQKKSKKKKTKKKQKKKKTLPHMSKISNMVASFTATHIT